MNRLRSHMVDNAWWHRFVLTPVCAVLGHRWDGTEDRPVPDYPWIVEYVRDCRRCERWEHVDA